MDRRRTALQLGAQYLATGDVAAVMLAGSLGRGRGDAFSDVEVDVYWTHPPTDTQRRAPAARVGGTVTHLWPYDADDDEWSEEVRSDGVDVTISGFTCDTIDRWITALPTGNGLRLVHQLRLAAIHDGEVLDGHELVGAWRRASPYPRGLAVATAASFLAPARFSRWRIWRALAQRGDLVVVHRACADACRAILGALCAVNRIYIEHPAFKWSHHLVARFDIAPTDLAHRLAGALGSPTPECAAQLEGLLIEVVGLVRATLPEVATPADDVLCGAAQR